MNNVFLIGRLCYEPIYYDNDSGLPACYFALSVERNKKKIATIPCEAEGKTAELIAKYCRKNFRIAISGELETDNERIFINENLPVFDVKVLSFEFVETRLDIIYGNELEFEDFNLETQDDWFTILSSLKKVEV